MSMFEKIFGFFKKSYFVILSLIIGQIVESYYGKLYGEAVFWIITGVISGIKYLKKREAKTLLDSYMVDKGFKDYKLLNIEQKENGLWTAECMILDYEKYYDHLKFDIEIDTWSGRYFDNFTEKEEEHLLKYSNNKDEEMEINELQEESNDIYEEEVFEAI